MKFKVLTALFKKVTRELSSPRLDFDHELFRDEFEHSGQWKSLLRDEDNSYIDPEVEAAWHKFLKTKHDEIMAIW
ncbi:MAG: hypothetical protein Q7T99_16215 [Pseudomonas sp.]|nr:hypothetical protein [Pseudomonas sp.]